MSGYKHGDRVKDVRTGTLGTVTSLNVTADELAEGCAHTEVKWDGLCVASELCVAEHNGITPA